MLTDNITRRIHGLGRAAASPRTRFLSKLSGIRDGTRAERKLRAAIRLFV
ncbi:MULTISPECIES: hypothetical protein [Paraburkholderia]|uniref:Uncharacterized protein n=2 Tax=Paraburkholderia TaxID=1822464 RepID=A0ABU9SF81_9BURK